MNRKRNDKTENFDLLVMFLQSLQDSAIRSKILRFVVLLNSSPQEARKQIIENLIKE